MLSVNALARPLVERLLAQAEALELSVNRDTTGACIVDAGIQVRGSIAAGLLIGEICMGGLGRVRCVAAASRAGRAGSRCAARSRYSPAWPASMPAGAWQRARRKPAARSSSRSAPARRGACGEGGAVRRTGYRDRADAGVLVLEVDRAPPTVVIDKLLRDCGLLPEGLTLILTPTTSLAGTTQVVARVLEVALHKAHELGYALGQIVDGVAAAPLPAPSPDGVIAMGRTNDAILYGGSVHLTVRGSDAAARQLALQLPSRNSRDYGRSFADIFKEVEYDFYKIDGALFAPAEVWVSNLESGNTWHAGALNMDLLRGLWLQQA
jgi:methenyltetrahydromethanopterin cyclohydrolase